MTWRAKTKHPAATEKADTETTQNCREMRGATRRGLYAASCQISARLHRRLCIEKKTSFRCTLSPFAPHPSLQSRQAPKISTPDLYFQSFDIQLVSLGCYWQRFAIRPKKTGKIHPSSSFAVPVQQLRVEGSRRTHLDCGEQRRVASKLSVKATYAALPIRRYKRSSRLSSVTPFSCQFKYSEGYSATAHESA